MRRTLAIGRPDTIISDVARANGFRHMGEFGKAYRLVFDETASTTLSKTRREDAPVELEPAVVDYDPNQG